MIPDGGERLLWRLSAIGNLRLRYESAGPVCDDGFVGQSDVEWRDGEIDGVSSWLMQGDPAVRWHVMDALLGCTPDQVALERARVVTEGWGARLLAMQESDGRWAAALYSPKWTSTTNTLLLLQRLGLARGNPHALAGCRQLWDSASWFDGGLNLAKTIQELPARFANRRTIRADAWRSGRAVPSSLRKIGPDSRSPM